MNRIALPGCRTEPLGSYLQGLGLWRCLTRLIDPHARAGWESGHLVLTTAAVSDVDELAQRLVAGFEPLPIVSPWNGGSGFAGNGKSATAERTLQAIRDSHEPRLAGVRAAVVAADTVVAEGRRRGWGGSKDELWDKARKPDVLTLARNRLPDEALAWLDAAVVLGATGDPVYSRLLGTGGNFGRQDLSATYLHRALAIVETPRRDWLHAALTGAENVPYERDAVGQFDPGRAGGVQSSPFEKLDDKGFVNPWSWLLTVEGTLLFASAVVRRLGADTSQAAIPFMVRSSPVGYPSSAAAENVMGEMWAPLWNRPAALTEIEQLLGEGMADWCGSAARTGLDFVRAIGALGVDRGITAFVRHVFVERLGQSPLAVPAGRIQVRERPEVMLLAPLDTWTARLRGDSSAAVQTALRELDTAQFALGTGQPHAAPRVLVALGRLHETVARSGAARAATGTPLVLPGAREWLTAAGTGLPELRLAAALASGRDKTRPGLTLRALFIPEETKPRHTRPQWTDRPSLVSLGAGAIAALAAAHRRRARAVPEPDGDIDPAVGGVLSTFRYAVRAPLDDVTALATGRVDELLLGDYLKALILLDWSDTAGIRLPAPPHVGLLPAVRAPQELRVIAPFFSADPLQLRLREDQPLPAPVPLRPGPDWIPQLEAGRVNAVAQDARHRMRIAGIRCLPGPPSHLDGHRVAAALLVPLAPATRESLVRAVADLPPNPRVVAVEGETA
ncbi:type I-U CRISPR-associated protein Csx17 [Nocardia sp. NRRL S-836]|uniref:type I-G CRISPR-associated protein Cas8g1/Csx17 n=1 Tax=Nocardia sp. NRRL S-836 TaxID=1519492 RepID=UPI0007C83519|nr:type I-U CRISPR-associated protein Csx17 [Nocardia sp. NRRL S-836]